MLSHIALHRHTRCVVTYATCTARCCTLLSLVTSPHDTSFSTTLLTGAGARLSKHLIPCSPIAHLVAPDNHLAPLLAQVPHYSVAPVTSPHMSRQLCLTQTCSKRLAFSSLWCFSSKVEGRRFGNSLNAKGKANSMNGTCAAATVRDGNNKHG